MEKGKTVGVIIPTYKPDEKLGQLLQMLECQSCRPDQIIIMNTGEAYFPTAVVNEMDHVEVHHITKPEFDHGGTRNQGARYCLCDIIVFLTQDAVPKNEFLIEELVKPLIKDYDQKDRCVAAAYARQLPTEDCGYLEAYTRTFNYPAKDRIKSQEDIPILGIKTFFCSNVCAAYRKDLYQELGGFVSRAIFNEDMIFAGRAVKAGYRIAYCSKAMVVHSHNYSSMQQLRRNFDLAVSQKDHPEVFGGIRSESEGLRLVRKTGGYLVKQGKWYLIPQLIIVSGFKYIGYFLGKRYKSLPAGLVTACSMNKSYWRKRKHVKDTGGNTGV